jgi:large subunit ribosomal protein L9
MPAGPNGKLYGAVTSQTIMEELAKQDFRIERKRIELPGNSLKNVGKYKVTVKLYENAQAECTITVEGQAIKSSSETSAQKGRRKRPETVENTAVVETVENTAVAETAENKAVAETAENKAPEAAVPEGPETGTTPEEAGANPEAENAPEGPEAGSAPEDSREAGNESVSE